MQKYRPGDWDTRTTTVVTVLGQNRLLGADHRRIAVYFTKINSFNGVINVKGCNSTTAGFLLDLNTNEKTFLYRDWGGIVGLDWYAFCVTNPENYLIVESLYVGG